MLCLFPSGLLFLCRLTLLPVCSCFCMCDPAVSYTRLSCCCACMYVVSSTCLYYLHDFVNGVFYLSFLLLVCMTEEESWCAGSRLPGEQLGRHGKLRAVEIFIRSKPLIIKQSRCKGHRYRQIIPPLCQQSLYGSCPSTCHHPSSIYTICAHRGYPPWHPQKYNPTFSDIFFRIIIYNNNNTGTYIAP